AGAEGADVVAGVGGALGEDEDAAACFDGADHGAGDARAAHGALAIDEEGADAAREVTDDGPSREVAAADDAGLEVRERHEDVERGAVVHDEEAAFAVGPLTGVRSPGIEVRAGAEDVDAEEAQLGAAVADDPLAEDVVAGRGAGKRGLQLEGAVHAGGAAGE